jgi:hypothetical protein
MAQTLPCCCPAILQPCPAHMVTPDMHPNTTGLTGQAAADALHAMTFSSVQECLTRLGYGFDGQSSSR